MIDVLVGSRPLQMKYFKAWLRLLSMNRELTKKWISKWRARPKEMIRHPADCLLDRDDIIFTEAGGIIVPP